MGKMHWLGCKKYTENKNLYVSHATDGRAMFSAYCFDYNSKRNRFVKKQDAKGLSNKSGLKISLSEHPILGEIFFDWFKYSYG